jgi:hypothetical protein
MGLRQAGEELPLTRLKPDLLTHQCLNSLFSSKTCTTINNNNDGTFISAVSNYWNRSKRFTLLPLAIGLFIPFTVFQSELPLGAQD